MWVRKWQTLVLFVLWAMHSRVDGSISSIPIIHAKIQKNMCCSIHLYISIFRSYMVRVWLKIGYPWIHCWIVIFPSNICNFGGRLTPTFRHIQNLLKSYIYMYNCMYIYILPHICCHIPYHSPSHIPVMVRLLTFLLHRSAIYPLHVGPKTQLISRSCGDQ